MRSIQIKEAKTTHPVHEFIRRRWSARSFSEKPISQETLETIFEAASWAPSANNEQPWEYFYAHRGTEGFQKIWECLAGGNKPWTKHAATLAVAVARKTFLKNGQPNPTAEHDLGLANATLLLQARALDVFGHPMGGFDKPKTAQMLGLDETREPICVIAFGYLDDPEKLEEPFKTRELTPRTRRGLEDFVRKVE